MISTSLDCTKSGRIDSFEVYKVPVTNIGGKETKIDRMLGGSINWNYNSDNKISGSVKVSGEKPADGNTLLRIYYKPQLDGVNYSIELATVYAELADATWEYGRWVGEYDIKGMAARFTESDLMADFTVGVGGSALSKLNQFMANRGAPRIINVPDKTYSKSTVVAKAGDSEYKALSGLAKKLNAHIDVDTHGRMTVTKYVPPSNRPIVYTIPSGAASVTLPGIDYTWDGYDKPNRVHLRFEEKGEWKYVDKGGWWWSRSDGTWPADCTEDIDGRHMKFNKSGYCTNPSDGTSRLKFTNVITATAVLPDSSPISKKKRGRYITSYEKITDLNPRTQANLQKKANAKLLELASRTSYYEFECYFLPIQIGDVVKFKPGSKEIKGMVSEIDLSLDVGAKMKVKLLKLGDA